MAGLVEGSELAIEFPLVQPGWKHGVGEGVVVEIVVDDARAQLPVQGRAGQGGEDGIDRQAYPLLGDVGGQTGEIRST